MSWQGGLEDSAGGGSQLMHDHSLERLDEEVKDHPWGEPRASRVGSFSLPTLRDREVSAVGVGEGG